MQTRSIRIYVSSINLPRRYCTLEGDGSAAEGDEATLQRKKSFNFLKSEQYEWETYEGVVGAADWGSSARAAAKAEDAEGRAGNYG